MPKLKEKKEEVEEQEVAAGETEGNEAENTEVEMTEKDARGILSELKSRIDKTLMTPELLEKMVRGVMEKMEAEKQTNDDSLRRKGAFEGVDAEDPKETRALRRKGRLSDIFTFKNAMNGGVPRRWANKYQEELKELQDMQDEILICSKVLGENPRDLNLWDEYEEVASAFASKALVSTVSGSGDDFVPTNFSSQLIEKVRLILKVAALHDRIPMTSNPFTVPLEGADSTAVLAAESTVEATEAGRITASTPSTSNVTFTAKKLASRTVFSEEITQDSIINILDFVRKKISVALANAIETATINGDTAGTHQDADVTTATDARKAWNGYRKLTRGDAKVDAGGDALDAADMRNARKAMDKFGINPADLAWVVGVNAFHQMLSETDANGFSDFRTLDKIGPRAQVLTGQMGAFDGIPVIVSEFVRENLGASGVYDGTNTSRTAINLVNRTRFWYGDRLSVTLRTFEDIQTDQIVMVIKQRLDFQPVEDSDTLNLVATVIDILTS